MERTRMARMRRARIVAALLIGILGSTSVALHVARAGGRPNRALQDAEERIRRLEEERRRAEEETRRGQDPGGPGIGPGGIVILDVVYGTRDEDTINKLPADHPIRRAYETITTTEVEPLLKNRETAWNVVCARNRDVAAIELTIRITPDLIAAAERRARDAGSDEGARGIHLQTVAEYRRELQEAQEKLPQARGDAERARQSLDAIDKQIDAVNARRSKLVADAEEELRRRG